MSNSLIAKKEDILFISRDIIPQGLEWRWCNLSNKIPYPVNIREDIDGPNVKEMIRNGWSFVRASHYPVLMTEDRKAYSFDDYIMGPGLVLMQRQAQDVPEFLVKPASELSGGWHLVPPSEADETCFRINDKDLDEGSETVRIIHRYEFNSIEEIQARFPVPNKRG